MSSEREEIAGGGGEAGTRGREAGYGIECRRGGEILPFIRDAARLRIEVFREFPYLYDGDSDYEERYLRTYADSPRSLFVLAREAGGGRVVGVSTAIPLDDAEAEFQQPFRAAGIEPAEVFYFGESVLERSWRGRGIGGRFFDERERCARALPGIRMMAFCAVDRPVDHPRRPADYVPLDRFWTRRGFVKRPDLATTYSWKEVGEAEESPKPMTFWVKPLPKD